jgi:aspartate aminotransferase-like enzyme
MTRVTLSTDEGDVVAKANTFYFVRDGQIVFAKGYHELGIDASRITNIGSKENKKFDYDYLRPILENLIREHVQPQEAEREGQEP